MVFQKKIHRYLTQEMLKKTFAHLIVLQLFLCLQFCSLTVIKEESPKINTVRKGSKFKINLPEDHSSGYLWQLSENYNKTLIQDIGAVWHGSEKGIDFNLKALSVGETTITLILRKYNDTATIKTFIVNIVNE